MFAPTGPPFVVGRRLLHHQSWKNHLEAGSRCRFHFGGALPGKEAKHIDLDVLQDCEAGHRSTHLDCLNEYCVMLLEPCSERLGLGQACGCSKASTG